MPFNLLKKFAALLDIGSMAEKQRNTSLMGVFKRDIEENQNFNFQNKVIRPIKKDGQDSMQILFNHLTTRLGVDSNGKKLTGRVFEMARSERLHWLKHHVEEAGAENVEVFSCEERIDGRNTIRTYIYNRKEDYVIILEPQKSGRDYFLLTAYCLNEPGGKKQIEKKLKKKLPDIH